jgi:integrase
MSSLKLSKTVVERLCSAHRDVVAWDEGLPGFGIRVKPTGVRSYLVQYRNRRTGKSNRMTLGRHGPLLTFDQAKKQARAILADALRGQDPVAERQAARKAPTMNDLAQDYLERHAIPNKRQTSVRNDRAMMAKIILPKMGSKKVDGVARRDIEALHLSLRKSPYWANRVLALLSKMFSLAVIWGWRANNPVKGIARYQEEKRDRWLSDEEMCRLLGTLDRHPNQMIANAIRLQLLTGARIGEVLSARRDAFDLNRGVWRKPSHQTKQNRTEHIPLSAQAVALVAVILDASSSRSPYLFPSRNPAAPTKRIHKAWAKIVKAAGLTNYRPHDNRHTYASHLVSSGLSLEIVGRLMGHTSPVTTKRYAHLADDPLRQATARFGNKVERLARPMNKLDGGFDAEVAAIQGEGGTTSRSRVLALSAQIEGSQPS